MTAMGKGGMAGEDASALRFPYFFIDTRGSFRA